jgi:hypothetical protein
MSGATIDVIECDSAVGTAGSAESKCSTDADCGSGKECYAGGTPNAACITPGLLGMGAPSAPTLTVELPPKPNCCVDADCDEGLECYAGCTANAACIHAGTLGMGAPVSCNSTEVKILDAVSDVPFGDSKQLEAFTKLRTGCQQCLMQNIAIYQAGDKDGIDRICMGGGGSMLASQGTQKEGEACGVSMIKHGDCEPGLDCKCVGACADEKIADAPSTCVKKTEPLSCKDCVAAGRSWQIGTCNPSADCMVMDVGCFQDSDSCATWDKQQAQSKVCPQKQDCKSCAETDGCLWARTGKECFMGADYWGPPEDVSRTLDECRTGLPPSSVTEQSGATISTSTTSLPSRGATPPTEASPASCKFPLMSSGVIVGMALGVLAAAR